MANCRLRAGRRAPAVTGRRAASRRSVAAVFFMLALAAAPSSAALAVAAVVVVTATPAEAQADAWVEPVRATVVDGYRPPAHLGAPGNRGWEYLTEPGTVVVAAGGGVVVFAGPIGGSDYVSIQHPDGRRTTYSHVATITVDVGDIVSAGDPIATTGERLHFGVRVGDEYRDPGELFTAPTSGPGGGAAPFGDGLRLIPATERAAFARNRPAGSGLLSGDEIDRGAIAPRHGTAPRPGTAPRAQTAPSSTALGRWLASVDLVRGGVAGSAWGWSGAPTATLAGGRRHSAVGP